VKEKERDEKRLNTLDVQRGVLMLVVKAFVEVL
jgi:hypothetical protein